MALRSRASCNADGVSQESPFLSGRPICLRRGRCGWTASPWLLVIRPARPSLAEVPIPRAAATSRAAASSTACPCRRVLRSAGGEPLRPAEIVCLFIPAEGCCSANRTPRPSRWPGAHRPTAGEFVQVHDERDVFQATNRRAARDRGRPRPRLTSRSSAGNRLRTCHWPGYPWAFVLSPASRSPASRSLPLINRSSFARLIPPPPRK